MKITRTFKQNTCGQKREYKLNLIPRYARLVLWFFNVSDGSAYLKMMDKVALYKTKSGTKFTTQFLKECVRLIQHFKSGNPTTSLPGGVRVATQRGLPLIIPHPLRLLIEAQDGKSLRIVLTLLSIYRVFKYPSEPKLQTITDPFTGICGTFVDAEIWPIRRLFDKYVTLRNIVGNQEPIPLRTAGPNFKISILGASLDALAWRNASEELRNSFEVLACYFNAQPLAAMLKEEGEIASRLTTTKVPRLGKLSLKAEPAGKIRVFAIVDVWTQSVLEPLHEFIYSILRNIPQDGTFNQTRPLDLLRAKLSENSKVFSYDLSAATDRLPLTVQVQVLSTFLLPEVAKAWATLLVGRDYELRSLQYRYTVGQPMGALSSFGMLALTHHFIVQLAARRIGHKGWFDMYALLGDDIVIAHPGVAESYHYIMSEYLGVTINLSKSLVSDKGVMEFAKRLLTPTEEFTPLGPKNIMGCLRNPANIPALLHDYFGKGGGVGDWTGSDVVAQFSKLSHDIVRVSKGARESLAWTILGPFGFVESPSVAPDFILDVDGLEEIRGDTFVPAVKETLLNKISKEWESAFAKSLEAALEVCRRSSHPHFTADGDPVKPHIFPSYRSLTIRAVDKVVEIADNRTLDFYPQMNELDWWDVNLYQCYRLPENQRGTKTNPIKDVLASLPTYNPYANPWVKPRVVRPRISRLGIDFFKEVTANAKIIQTQWDIEDAESEREAAWNEVLLLDQKFH